MRLTRGGRTAIAVVALSSVGLAFGPQAAQAAPPHSSLVANPTSLNLDVVNNPSQTVTVNLDANCLNVFKSGQTYSITATSSDLTGATTVSPAQSDALQCPPAKKGAPTSATFSVSAVCPPTSATISFAPVAGPAGIQKKLSGTSISVTVTDVTNSCGGGGGGGGGGDGSNPAAPAVTNAYLNANPAVTAACQAAFPANHWRGQVISFIAHWMPRPESLKDTYFADPNDWILYVETEDNVLCGYSDPTYGTYFLAQDGSGTQSSATFTSPPMSNYATA